MKLNRKTDDREYVDKFTSQHPHMLKEIIYIQPGFEEGHSLILEDSLSHMAWQSNHIYIV